MVWASGVVPWTGRRSHLAAGPAHRGDLEGRAVGPPQRLGDSLVLYKDLYAGATQFACLMQAAVVVVHFV